MNEEIVLKTAGLNNPETYVLTHNRFKTYMVSSFSDLNKAEIYEMPYRKNPHNEIERFMSFPYLNLFRPNEDVESYHFRKPHDANFLFEIEDRKDIHVGEKVFNFETNDAIVNHSSELGFSDVKFPFAYGEGNIYFMLHQKNIPIQEYEKSTVQNEYENLYKKDRELKGDNITDGNAGIVEYGDDFLNYKIIHSKQ